MALANPSIKDVLNFFTKKFEELEKSIDHKWEHLEDLKKKLDQITTENKTLEKENESFKYRVGPS